MLFYKKIHQYLLIALLLCVVYVKNEEQEKSHSNSVAGMEKLLELESQFIEGFNNYANEMQAKLSLVRSFVTAMQTEQAKAAKNREHYLSNPLNAFALIRRMHRDWIEWKNFIEEPMGWAQADLINEHKDQLPSKTDLEDACVAMKRLKDVYDLKIRDMAKGLLNDMQYNVSLNALDTYELGSYFHNHQDTQLAREWFSECSNMLLDGEILHPITLDQSNMLFIFASTLVKMKYYSVARPLIEIAMKLSNEKNIQKILNLRGEIERLSPNETFAEVIAKNSTSLYQKGCRGQFATQSKLYCQYKFSPAPFLRLAPLKMELRLLDPLIIVYYDVLSAAGIKQLQDYARPLLEIAKVYEDGKTVFQQVRTSKGTWLDRNYSNWSRTIGRRIEDMTDLTLNDSAEMQILNYGLGGHYAAHYDYFDFVKENKPISEINDRIATVLFYLTQVDQGGATVFPRLQQSFSPQPGMAVFWLNLHDDGTPNNQTLHGACPVLVGSKWVMTQWIEERSQIYTRPCLKR